MNAITYIRHHVSMCLLLHMFCNNIQQSQLCWALLKVGSGRLLPRNGLSRIILNVWPVARRKYWFWKLPILIFPLEAVVWWFADMIVKGKWACPCIVFLLRWALGFRHSCLGFRQDNLGVWWARREDVADISSPGLSWRPVRVLVTNFVLAIVTLNLVRFIRDTLGAHSITRDLLPSRHKKRVKYYDEETPISVYHEWLICISL